MNLYDYKTVSYARPQKALPTNDPIDFYDYKTVSYARPQKALPTNNPMVSDTAQSVPSTLGTILDGIFSVGTTSSSSGSIWRDLGSIAGKMSGQMSNKISKPLSDDPERRKPLSDDPERRKYESALMEAEAILGPQYQRAREQTMSEVDRNMVSRGFYGQAPGDAIRASTLTDLDMAYQAALGNYATNIMDRRAQMDLQKEQMDLQKYMFDKGLEEQWKMFDKRLEEQWKMFEKERKQQRQEAIGSVAGNLLTTLFSLFF